jgi:hypothetical protein
MTKFIAVTALAICCSACSHVSSATPGSTASTGDAWYTKETTFFGMTVSNKVYYCPRESPTNCIQAQFVWIPSTYATD